MALRLAAGGAVAIVAGQVAWLTGGRASAVPTNPSQMPLQVPGRGRIASESPGRKRSRIVVPGLSDTGAASRSPPPSGAGVNGKKDECIFKVAAELGMKIAMWSSDSQGWRDQEIAPDGIARVAANALYDFRAGSIVLQHAIACDVLALPPILEESEAAGAHMPDAAGGDTVGGGGRPAGSYAMADSDQARSASDAVTNREAVISLSITIAVAGALVLLAWLARDRRSLLPRPRYQRSEQTA